MFCVDCLPDHTPRAQALKYIFYVSSNETDTGSAGSRESDIKAGTYRTVNSVLLSVKDLAVRAGEIVIQRSISLDLHPGELVALTGPSGSGKTTLLRTIAGLQDPADGTIELEGKAPGEWGWPAFRRKLLLVAQQPALFDQSVADNLRRLFEYRSSQSAFPTERARELLDQLEVGADRMEQGAKTLSIGQQQRVSLIRALLLEPAIVCLDEPTSALDAASTELVENLISEEASRRGLAALIVTHNEQQATRWWSRRFVIPAAQGRKDGKQTQGGAA